MLEEQKPIAKSQQLIANEYEPLCQVPQVIKPEEYRMGEHKPPIFLVVLFFLVFVWAMISWIPFFGY